MSTTISQFPTSSGKPVLTPSCLPSMTPTIMHHQCFSTISSLPSIFPVQYWQINLEVENPPVLACSKPIIKRVILTSRLPESNHHPMIVRKTIGSSQPGQPPSLRHKRGVGGHPRRPVSCRGLVSRTCWGTTWTSGSSHN